jgi:hypothetical protein
MYTAANGRALSASLPLRALQTNLSPQRPLGANGLHSRAQLHQMALPSDEIASSLQTTGAESTVAGEIDFYSGVL